MRDDSTGGWVPMGGGGLSNVSVRKRRVHHDDHDDQPCKHEYLIHGKRISDQSVRDKREKETNLVDHEFFRRNAHSLSGFLGLSVCAERVFTYGIRGCCFIHGGGGVILGAIKKKNALVARAPVLPLTSNKAFWVYSIFPRNRIRMGFCFPCTHFGINFEMTYLW